MAKITVFYANKKSYQMTDVVDYKEYRDDDRNLLRVVVTQWKHISDTVKTTSETVIDIDSEVLYIVAVRSTGDVHVFGNVINSFDVVPNKHQYHVATVQYAEQETLEFKEKSRIRHQIREEERAARLERKEEYLAAQRDDVRNTANDKAKTRRKNKKNKRKK